MDQVHPGTPKVLKIVYKCPICSLNYSKTGRVKDHILQVHTTARAYACKVCGKRFGSPTALGTHKKVHMVSCREISLAKNVSFETSSTAAASNCLEMFVMK